MSDTPEKLSAEDRGTFRREVDEAIGIRGVGRIIDARLATLEERVQRIEKNVADHEQPCRISEYDGAYKCWAHDREWGAVLDPDEPCEGWFNDELSEGGEATGVPDASPRHDGAPATSGVSVEEDAGAPEPDPFAFASRTMVVCDGCGSKRCETVGGENPCTNPTGTGTLTAPGSTLRAPEGSVPEGDGERPKDPVAAAIEWAARAHAGQVYRGYGDREDEAYILHPLRLIVALHAHPNEAWVVAALHDVAEDTDAGLPGWLTEDEREALRLLTRDKEGTPYPEYIGNLALAKGIPGLIARGVKVADLRDNLAHNPPPRLRERYEAALAILAPQPPQERESGPKHVCGAYDYARSQEAGHPPCPACFPEQPSLEVQESQGEPENLRRIALDDDEVVRASRANATMIDDPRGRAVIIGDEEYARLLARLLRSPAPASDRVGALASDDR